MTIMRAIAVVVSVVLYVVVFLIVWLTAWWVSTDQPPTGEGLFYEAHVEAEGDGAAAACGFRKLAPDQEVKYSHEDIVRISRCLQRRGYMPTSSLETIESGWFGYRYGRRETSEAYGFVTARDEPTPRWVSLLWVPGLAGLAFTIWLVGFQSRRRAVHRA